MKYTNAKAAVEEFLNTTTRDAPTLMDFIFWLGGRYAMERANKTEPPAPTSTEFIVPDTLPDDFPIRERIDRQGFAIISTREKVGRFLKLDRREWQELRNKILLPLWFGRLQSIRISTADIISVTTVCGEEHSVPCMGYKSAAMSLVGLVEKHLPAEVARAQ